LETYTEGHDREDLSWCTVVINFSQLGFPTIKEQIETFKLQFTASLSHDPRIAWVGRIEVDYLEPAQLSKEPAKLRTLSSMGFLPDEGAVLIPHLHAVLVHPGWKREQVQYRLQKHFPGSRRVQVRAFRQTRSLPDSLDAFARYPLKPMVQKEFLAGRGSKTHAPRRPDILRYTIRTQDYLDGRHARRLNFDKAAMPTLAQTATVVRQCADLA
jgi:hypothetical protein